MEFNVTVEIDEQDIIESFTDTQGFQEAVVEAVQQAVDEVMNDIDFHDAAYEALSEYDFRMAFDDTATEMLREGLEEAIKDIASNEELHKAVTEQITRSSNYLFDQKIRDEVLQDLATKIDELDDELARLKRPWYKRLFS